MKYSDVEDSSMDLRQQIAEQVDKLPPFLQEEALRFVETLNSAPTGEPGTALLRFASSLDPQSAREMAQAIEEECERVEAGEW